MFRSGAITLVERRVIRRGWTTTAMLVFLLAIGAGVTMAAAAGGRRAATSYDRFVDWSDSGEVAAVIGMTANSSEEASARFDQLAAMPEVESAMRGVELGNEVARDGRVLPFRTLSVFAVDFDNPVAGKSKVVDGRVPDTDAVNEAAVGFNTAERLGIQVGDTFDVRFLSYDDPSQPAEVETVTVVGIGASIGDFPSVNGQPSATLAVTPAFMRAHLDRVDWTNGILQMRLRDGSPAGVEAFRTAVDESGIQVAFLVSIYDDIPGVRKVMRIQAGALWLTAVVVAGAAAVVLMQFMRRQTADASADLRMLGVLGLTRPRVVASGALHGLLAGAMGAAGAIVVAMMASSTLPRGVARIADPDIGFHADLVVLTIGTGVTVLVTTVAGALATWLAARSRDDAAPRPATLKSITAQLPPAPAAGIRFALMPNSSGPAAPIRIGLLGLAFVLAALIAVVSMTASFDQVLHRPDLAGSTWDLSAAYDDPADGESVMPMLDADPAVAAIGSGGWGELMVNGQPVYSVYLVPGGDVEVAIDSGRPPAGADEIALGAAELTALHVSVGDTVVVGIPDMSNTVDARVSGRAIIAAPVYQSLRPGQGGAVPSTLVAKIIGEDPPANLLMIDLVDDDNSRLRDEAAALTDRIQPNFWFTRTDQGGVRSMRDLRLVPTVMMALLALMATAALVHRILMSSRSGRRQHAVLRSLGFTPAQSVQAGGVQGLTVATLALLGAVPLGIIGAIAGWRWIANFLVVVPDPVVPIDIVALVVAAELVIGVVAGLVLAGLTTRKTVGALLSNE